MDEVMNLEYGLHESYFEGFAVLGDRGDNAMSLSGLIIWGTIKNQDFLLQARLRLLFFFSRFIYVSFDIE